MGVPLKGKMVRIHRKPAIAVFGDESRRRMTDVVNHPVETTGFDWGKALIHPGKARPSRVIRQPESLPVRQSTYTG
jgi:hypothetical protein